MNEQNGSFTEFFLSKTTKKLIWLNYFCLPTSDSTVKYIVSNDKIKSSVLTKQFCSYDWLLDGHESLALLGFIDPS